MLGALENHLHAGVFAFLCHFEVRLEVLECQELDFIGTLHSDLWRYHKSAPGNDAPGERYEDGHAITSPLALKKYKNDKPNAAMSKMELDFIGVEVAFADGFLHGGIQTELVDGAQAGVCGFRLQR